MPETAPLPRAEHPRPQLRRDDWLNLNGQWTCRIDPLGSPSDARASTGLELAITVPFCPESRLSGIGHTDFIESLWYHRPLELPESWRGRRVLLHFGAVDWHARVYLDGRLVGEHWGGSTAFSIDLDGHAEPGRRHELVVHAQDRTRSGEQPCGKQSREPYSYGCYYTRTTGIWQTVWLEATGSSWLAGLRLTPDLHGGRLLLTPRLGAPEAGLVLEVETTLDGRPAGRLRAPAISGQPLPLGLDPVRAWAPGSPTLYDLEVRLLDADGRVLDRVASYCGLRSIAIAGDQVLLNGRPIYQRLVLDQGFYQDGVWTAPSDEALKADIELAMAMGFNGARLHQKVFEPRFHYWADRLGYLTWGESPSWGFDVDSPVAARNFLVEWTAIVEQCASHPSIIAWSPLNESGHRVGRHEPISEPHRRLILEAAALTRRLDPSRPVNDASGWVHQDTDLWTAHCYEQDPATLHEIVSPSPPDIFKNAPQSEPAYTGQPYFLAEFGGAAWTGGGELGVRDTRDKRVDNKMQQSWGYGEAPRSLEEFEARLRAQLATVRRIGHLRGFCYTQLTDVEQEQNGVLTFAREPKLPLEVYREIFDPDSGTPA